MTMAQFCRETGISENTLRSCINGNPVSEATVRKICEALKLKESSAFEEGVHSDEKLSQKTIDGYRRFLNLIFEFAKREKVITENPMDNTLSAAGLKRKTEKKTRKKAYQEEQVTAIMTAAESEPLKWQLIIALLLDSGARRGEILALTWKDVDFDEGCVHINKAILANKKKTDSELSKYYLDTTKTDEDDRIVDLAPETMELFRQYREEWEEFRTAAGSAWPDKLRICNSDQKPKTYPSNFIFISSRGDRFGYPMYPDSITSYLKKFSKKHKDDGIPHLNPHAFRHTAASLALSNGVDPVTVANRLGHSVASTTTDIYGHKRNDAAKRAAEKIGDSIYGYKRKKETDNDNEE